MANFEFDPQRPFPLLDLEDCFRMAAREHARKVDAWLGFDFAPVEERVRSGRFAEDKAKLETWSHLSPQVFLTPYLELRAILELLGLREGARIVDLGAAYCRMAFVIESEFTTLEFVGIECEAERAFEAERVMERKGLKRSRVVCADLSAPGFEIPVADAYFIYDCGTRDDIHVTLEKLKALHAREGRGFQLVARGLRVREALESGSTWLYKTGPLFVQSDFLIYACDDR